MRRDEHEYPSQAAYPSQVAAVRPHGLHNLRWVGAGGDRPRLRPRMLWRSSALLAPNPGVLEDLAALGVGTVIDLRDASERAMMPMPEGGGLQRRWVPVFDNQLDVLSWDSLDGLYTIMLERFAHQLAAGVAAVAEALPRGPVLVHCTAGKDRTGLVVALIQDTLEVPRERILDDYRLSARLLGADYLADLAAASGRGPLAGVRAHRATASPGELLQAAFNRIDHGGGSRHFLRHHGVEEHHLELLSDHLVED